MNPQTPKEEQTAVTSPAVESGAAVPTATTASTATAKGPWAGAADAYGVAFEQIKKNPQPLLIMVAVYVVLNIIASVMSGYQSYFDNDTAYSYLPELSWLIFLVPLARYALAVADKRSVTMGELFTFTAQTFFYLFVAGIIVSLVVGLSALALLIPLIWTLAWFAFTEFPIVEKTITPTDAMSESKSLAQNHKGKVWGIIGIGVLLAIPALILALIPFVGVAGIAALQIVATCAIAVLYRWLQANRATQ